RAGQGGAMTGPRLTLSGMLGLIALIAIGLGALRFASVYWASAVSWVLLLWLCAGLLGVIFRRGSARDFWVGFTVFGWIYLLLVHTSLMSTTLSAEMSAGIHQAIDSLLPFDAITVANPANAIEAQHDHAVRLIRLRALADMYLNFAFAVFGGFLALRFTARRDQQTTPPSEEPAR
ncbi:MAG: hypothetical protein P4L84_14305, partial [Isosphaeraceae bacterium]|nr:hypothetical protein [Isosphaeraceae bacterium]